jgi:hypothetical protein
VGGGLTIAVATMVTLADDGDITISTYVDFIETRGKKWCVEDKVPGSSVMYET